MIGKKQMVDRQLSRYDDCLELIKKIDKID